MPLKRRHDYSSRAAVPELGKVEISYPTPNIADRIVIERVPITPEKYEPLAYHSPHETYDQTGLFLVWQGKVKAENNQVVAVRVYANDLANDDWFNGSIKYSGDAALHPIYVRNYIELREDYVTLPRASPLTTLMVLRLTDEGVYDGTGTPDVTITPTGTGSGATARAIMNPARTKVIGLELLTAGSGYDTAPTIAFSGGGETTVAEAIALIQPAAAVLVKEEASRLEASDQLASLFVRVARIYEVLPGPWLPYSRWDDDLGSIQGQRRAVLTAIPPQQSVSSATNKTVYEARDGSAIVSMEIVETWGDLPPGGIGPRIPVPYEHRYEVSIDDPIPQKFQTDDPTITESQVEPGQAALPELGDNELRRSSAEVNKYWKREGVTRREQGELPRELKDYELGGINTHGSEFGGTLETTHTLDRGAPGAPPKETQKVQEGFEILKSSVEALGRGFTWRKTQRLFNGGQGSGPYIELTDGGAGYIDDPAVVFFGGNSGSGAAGVASLSINPIAVEADPGGVFDLSFGTPGDEGGAFTFLGKRYNGGVWRNPATAGVVGISAYSAVQPALTPAQLSVVVDRSAATGDIDIWPNRPGGGHGLIIDLGPGRSLKAAIIALQLSNDTFGVPIQEEAQIFGFNVFGAPLVPLCVSMDLPGSAGAWTTGALDNTNGYRYFLIYGLTPAGINGIFPNLILGEVELYGELTITPVANLVYANNGDTNGVFHHLGRQANGGSAWSNPQTNGAIVISAPYDDLALGTFDSMVDRQPSNTYLVDRAGSEIWFDLGEDRSLMLRTVSFRQRADFNTSMTQVHIQGKNDPAPGAAWEENQLLEVSGNASQWTTIPILPASFTKPYRFYRLILVAPLRVMAVGEIELYGTLQLGPPAPPSPGPVGAGVTGIQVTDHGSGYDADHPPRVIITPQSGDPGSGAEAEAVMAEDTVESVRILNPGTGYLAVPDVEFQVGTGGTGVQLESTIAGGVVTAIGVVDGGSGYTEPPKVKIVSSTGSGAAAHSEITAGVVTAIVIDNGGTGYELPPTVVAYPFTDPEADAEIGFDLAEITLIDGGEGYSSAPAVHIEGDGIPATAIATVGFPLASAEVTNAGENFSIDPVPVFGGDGTGAAGTTTRSFGVASTSVDTPGSNYLTEPQVVVEGDGRDAQFAALVGRRLLRIDMASQGSGYTSDPAVDLSAGDGTGGTAHSVRSFKVASIAVGAGGTTYTVAPTITIPPPTGVNGVQATAHAVLTAGAVTSIVIDNPGFGYLSAPTATMTGGDGTGATIGAVTLESAGAVDHVVLDTAGSDYSAAFAVAFTGGGGTLATANALLDTAFAGPIVKIAIINPGQDYSVAPILTIPDGTSGGSGAEASCTLSTTGKIKSITITDPGEGYTFPPPITFSGVGVTPAAGQGILAPTGSVKSVELLSNGEGFRAGATVEFIGGGGTGAEATITPGVCGKVVTVQLTKPGGPFTEPPDVFFVGGHGAGAMVAAASFGAGPDMSFPRAEFPAVLLPDGKVLLAGGGGAVEYEGADIFSPGADTIGPTGDMATEPVFAGAFGHKGVLLSTGKVLTVGGSASLNAAQLYDITAGTWALTDFLASGEDQEIPGLVLLDSGKAMVIGGYGFDKNAATFDPATELWTYVSDSIQSHTEHTATKLNDGRVLVVAGAVAQTSAEIFNPVGGTWAATPALNHNHKSHTATLLADGRVLVAGCAVNSAPSTAFVEIYDPVGNTWTDVAPMNEGRSYHAAVLLPDDRVLVTGGRGVTGVGATDRTTAEIYDVGTDTWELITGRPPRYSHAMIVLNDGRVLIAGGYVGGGTLLITTEILSVTPPAPTCPEIEDATGIYVLGTIFPELWEDTTDPTEGIKIHVVKSIVPARTPLPAGYVDIFPLDIYRSIQIVSKVDLHNNWPPRPNVYQTTQHMALPQTLLALYAIWDENQAQATSGGASTGTQRGAVSASIQVVGSIVIKKIDGFRGSALARVERTFWFGPPPDANVLLPTIIQPASGTAIVTMKRSSLSQSGLTYYANGQNDPNPPPPPSGGSLPGFNSYAKSSGSSGVTTQVLDISNVLTLGLSGGSSYNANNSSHADALNVRVDASGTLKVELPPSTPTSIVAGNQILAEVGVEKWRFGVYVRTLIYVTVPQIR